MGKTLRLSHNSFGLERVAVNETTLSLGYEDGTNEDLSMGYGSWRYNTLNGYPLYSIKSINRMQGMNQGFDAAVAYAWPQPMTLEVCVHYVNWISGVTYLFDFDKCEVSIQGNYPNTKPEIVPFTIQ